MFQGQIVAASFAVPAFAGWGDGLQPGAGRFRGSGYNVAQKEVDAKVGNPEEALRSLNAGSYEDYKIVTTIVVAAVCDSLRPPSLRRS
jgi:hypothetical protein